MNINEMLRLQGIDPTKFVVDVPVAQLGQQIGNAMSVNVIERLLVKALEAAKLIRPSSLKGKDSTLDRWENGQGFEQIRSSRRQVSTKKIKDNPKERIHKTIMLLNKGKMRAVIIDSGASFHLIDFDDLTQEERSRVYDLAYPIPLNTANGEVEATQAVQIYIPELEITVEAILLPKTPAVLSLGLLVEKEGFDYIWRRGTVPFLQKGQYKIPCHPNHDVPFINCTTGDTRPMLPGTNTDIPSCTQDGPEGSNGQKDQGNGGNSNPGGEAEPQVPIQEETGPPAAKAAPKVKAKAKAKAEQVEIGRASCRERV